jgi:hypothetical protein
MLTFLSDGCSTVACLHSCWLGMTVSLAPLFLHWANIPQYVLLYFRYVIQLPVTNKYTVIADVPSELSLTPPQENWKRAPFERKPIKLFFLSILYVNDRLCGLVVRVLGYRSGGPGSIPGTTRKKNVVGLERGALSLVSTTEELLDWKVAAPV